MRKSNIAQFDDVRPELSEDGEAAAATLDAVPGMGAPELASRGSDGSGDVTEPAKTKWNKKKKRIMSFFDFHQK